MNTGRLKRYAEPSIPSSLRGAKRRSNLKAQARLLPATRRSRLKAYTLAMTRSDAKHRSHGRID